MQDGDQSVKWPILLLVGSRKRGWFAAQPLFQPRYFSGAADKWAAIATWYSGGGSARATRQQLSNASSHHLHSHNHHHNHHRYHHHRQHRPRQMIYPLIPIACMIDSGINAGSRLRGPNVRISAGITRGIDARYARRILTGGISSEWNWCLSRTRGHGYRESCIFTQPRSVARFSPQHRIAPTECRLISTDLWFIGFLSLSLSLRLSLDYANDHRVKTAGGNTLSPFDDSLSCDEFVYLIPFDFLFSLFVHRIIEFWK